MASHIPSPNPGELLAPFLPALPAASMSTQPAIGILPLLSPILRQRVNFLSSSSTEPWLRLLCYDTAKAAKLAEIAQGGSLEPHPVSGEVEVDWDYDAEIRFRRVDQETIQALVVLDSLGLAFQLLHCVGDKEGGGDGWRVGEATVADKPSPFSQFGGFSTLAEAEPSAEDDYYAQYDDVQPAMDPHDPDEATEQAHIAPPLGLSQVKNHESPEATELNETQGAWTLAELEKTDSNPNSGGDDADRLSALVHPRPASSASSNGSQTVAKLEATADKQEQNEFGVKQHVSRSIRSLYFLARSSGINRDEFERLIHTELDVLGMMEDHD
ncbi:hypothetical protein AUP68_12506 [Ilyonectria robusta]